MSLVNKGDEMSQQLCHWRQRKLVQFCITSSLKTEDTAHVFGFNSYTSNILFLPNMHGQQRQTVGGKKAQ